MVNNAGGGVIAPTLARTEETPQATIGNNLEKVLDNAIVLIPVGRGTEADEVAAAVAFLAREDSGFITGQILSVNGRQQHELISKDPVRARSAANCVSNEAESPQSCQARTVCTGHLGQPAAQRLPIYRLLVGELPLHRGFLPQFRLEADT